MQKVEGSSPFIRFAKSPGDQGFLVLGASGLVPRMARLETVWKRGGARRWLAPSALRCGEEVVVVKGELLVCR